MSAFEVEVEVGKTPTVDRVSGGVGPKEERGRGKRIIRGGKKVDQEKTLRPVRQFLSTSDSPLI